jgi:hypothetical protein
MKKIHLIFLSAFLLLVSFAYAQMGGEMAGDHGQMQGGMTGEQQGHMSDMIEGHEVRGDIIKNMNHMSVLMNKMVDMMERTTDPMHMRKMAGMMQDMSQHMISMSRIMIKGSASQKEIQDLNQHHVMMQKRYELMQIW